MNLFSVWGILGVMISVQGQNWFGCSVVGFN